MTETRPAERVPAARPPTADETGVSTPAVDAPAGAADVDAPKVLDLAMRVGDALLSAGMSANDVVVFMLHITGAYGLRRVHVDVTYTAISASYYPTSRSAPHTSIRIVQPDVVDYTRVRRLDRLRVDIEAGRLPIDEAAAAFERIGSAPRPYPRWVSTLAQAGVGPAVSLLFTTSWKILLITLLTDWVVDRLRTGLNRRGVPAFFQQFAAAALITAVAVGVTYAGNHGVTLLAGVDPTLVVVGGIVMLVAGMMIVGAVQDAIDEFYVTASARVFEVALRTAGIVAGIVVALRLAQQLGAPLALSAKPVAFGLLGAQFVGVALVAAFFAIAAYADLVTILLAAAMALIGWFGFTAMSHAHADVVLANTAGALVAALVTTLLVRRTSVPGFALVSAALLPLVPGLSLYNGLLQVVGTSPATADPQTGGWTLFVALGVALGIGAGASLGTFLGRPIGDQLRRIPFPTRPRRRGRSGRGRDGR